MEGVTACSSLTQVELLRVEEVAQQLAVSIRSVHRMSAGRKPELGSVSLKHGGRRWPRKAVNAYVASLIAKQIPTYLRVT